MAAFSLNGHLTAEHHAAFAQSLIQKKYDAHFGATTVVAHPAAVWLALALILGLGGHRMYWLGYEWLHFGHVHFVGMDWVMVLTAIGLAIVSALLAGLYPTWQACRIMPASQLKTQ